MKKQYPTFLKGHLLTAMPALADPNFYQTVTCVCEHTPEGAVGIVVNRINSLISGKDIFDELNIDYSSDAESIKIHIGGPVHLNEIFVLHGPPFEWKGTLMVTSSIALSNTRDILEAIALHKGPECYMIALGCAGWSPDQLESEIKRNVWLTCDASKEIIFELPIETRWEAAMKKMGIDPALLSDKTGHA
ncbi:MAG TPA: YqgE/AlgH family protein [Desulfobacterales bacterium]|nr:YqgE/AlgH family protein [Desulfobacterales bacterium]